MIEITISVEGDSDAVAVATSDLLGTATTLIPGATKAEIAKDAELVLGAMPLGKAHGIPQYVEFLIRLGEDVSAGVIASWIYGKLKNSGASLRIEETVVEMDEGEIKRIVHRTIERS